MVRNQPFQDFERRGWEEVARSYADSIGRVTADVAGVLLDAANVVRGSAVLDVATGPGWVAAEAVERGASAVGVDIAQAMVDEARLRHPTIEIRRGSPETLPVGAETFDAVVSAFGMPHFADHEAFAAEAWRALRPAGRLAFASWYPPARNPFFDIALGAIARHGSLDVDLPDGVDMFHWANAESCQDLLTGAGFGPAVRHDVSLVWLDDDGPLAMMDFLRNGGVRARALFKAPTPEAKSAIADDIAASLTGYETDGTWSIPLNAFVVAAEKTTLPHAPTSSDRHSP